MEKEIGPEAKLKIELAAGKLKLSADYDGKQVDASLSISTDSDLLVDAIMELIPGDSPFERVMGDLLRVALKSVAV